jgi:hypothetical protein
MIRKDFSAIPSSGTGVPCVWEEGGGGYSVLIADQMAEKPRAMYVPRTPRLCGQHALIHVRPGYFIVETGFNGAMQIWRILEMIDLHIIGELVQEYLNGSWSVVYSPISERVNQNISSLINASWEKASDYECRRAYWATEPSHYNQDAQAEG